MAQETYMTLALAFGTLFGLVFFFIGMQIRYFEAYGLIAGYNTAPPEEQRRYDIEGLAQHVGNGLMTIGVLIAMAALFFYYEKTTLFAVTGALFFGVVFILLAGVHRFKPRVPGEPEFLVQRFFKRWLPASVFESMERGTRQWVIECKCGRTRDFWDAGGIRWKAVGERRQLTACDECRELTWHKIRRRS